MGAMSCLANIHVGYCGYWTNGTSGLRFSVVDPVLSVVAQGGHGGQDTHCSSGTRVAQAQLICWRRFGSGGDRNWREREMGRGGIPRHGAQMGTQSL